MSRGFVSDAPHLQFGESYVQSELDALPTPTVWSSQSTVELNWLHL